jgi:hypothetical protein
MANGREPLGTGVIWLLGQMVRLPVEAFVYTMEMMVKTLQGLQRMADRSVDALMGKDAPSSPDAPARDRNLSNSGPTVAATAHATGNAPDRGSDHHPNDTVNLTPDAIPSGGEKIEKEQRNMPDTNLSDDMLKLVRYKILFVKRDYEWAFPEAEDLVSDNMTGEAYTAWKVAEFIQGLDKRAVPAKWDDKNYPLKREDGKETDGAATEDKDKKRRDRKRYFDQHVVRDAKGEPVKNEKGEYTYTINFLPDDDKKYLRAFYEVLQRYPREKLRYEERHLEVLEQIRDRMDP